MLGNSIIKRGIKTSRWLARHHIPFSPKVVERVYNILCSCEIPYDSNVHPEVNWHHRAIGCVINKDSVIGENTVVRQNVTVGIIIGKPGAPVIGRNVDIGAGACILGPITLGDNSKIGANAVVLCDVPENCTAVGVPARVLHPKLQEY